MNFGARIVNLFLLRGFLLGIMILALILAAGQSVEVSELVIELFDECVWRPTSVHNASFHPLYHGRATCGSFYIKLAIFLMLIVIWSLLISIIVSSVVTRDFSRRVALVIELFVASLVPAFLTFRLITDGILRLDKIQTGIPTDDDYQFDKETISFQDSLINHPTALMFFGFTLLVAYATVILYYQISKSSVRSRRRQFIAFSTLPIGFFGISCAFFVIGSEAYQTFGALNLLLLFGIFLVGGFHLLALLGHRWHVPLIAIFLTLTAIQWTVLRRGESELTLSTLDASMMRQQADTEKSEVVEFFDAWLASRADRDDFKARKKPYPVYVIAAAGGGLHAALRTTRVIAELQMRCPAFLQHVFAISAVSGGALGAAVAAGTANALPQVETARCHDGENGDINDSLLNAVSTSYFSEDLLPTLLGPTLFPDLLYRMFVPSAVLNYQGLRNLDRSKFFEQALAGRWRKTLEDLTRKNVPKAENLDPEFFNRGIHSDEVWSARPGEASSGRLGSGPQTPGIIFNATATDVGRVFPISRLHLKFFRNSVIVRNFSEYQATLNVSEAVGISVRSPFILPAAAVEFPKTIAEEDDDDDGDGKQVPAKRIIRLVDGAYADNSGLLTALDVISTVRTSYEDDDQKDFRIKLIYIGERADQDECDTKGCLPSIMEPVVAAFLNTRIVSGNALISDTLQKEEREAQAAQKLGQLPLPFALPGEMLQVEAGGSAMGWLLSGQTRLKIISEIEKSLNEECIEAATESVKMVLRYTTMSCSLQDLRADFN